MAQSSCDCFVVLPPATAEGRVIFGKNADRPSSEVQEVVYLPAADHPEGSKVQCTYISVDQVAHTNAVILSKAAWMWGAEMGANDQGLCLGNNSVWTKLNSPSDLQQKLLGADMVRLALERASSALEAVEVIGGLLEDPGQGGPCSEEPGQEAWSYHNSFLIADPTTAWVLDSAGPYWAAQKVTEGVRNISNELSVGTRIDRSSSNLVEEAQRLGLYREDMGPFNFAQVFSEKSGAPDSLSQISFRYRHGLKMLTELSATGQFGVRDMFQVLRDEESGICMTDGSFLSTGSQVSVLSPPSSSPCPTPCCHWFTATPNPLTSIYKPFIFAPGASIGSATVSPQCAGDDHSQKTPPFDCKVDRRHALYHGHERLRELLGQEDAGGLALLSQLREMEDRCVDDMQDLLLHFEEQAYAKVACIFQHMADLELNFYK